MAASALGRKGMACMCSSGDAGFIFPLVRKTKSCSETLLVDFYLSGIDVLARELAHVPESLPPSPLLTPYKRGRDSQYLALSTLEVEVGKGER